MSSPPRALAALSAVVALAAPAARAAAAVMTPVGVDGSNALPFQGIYGAAHLIDGVPPQAPETHGHAPVDLSEVRFEGASAPEPATWMMMIAGFGLAGVAVRRRHRLAAA